MHAGLASRGRDMLHSQASGLSVDLTDARTQQRRGEAEHVPLCPTAVSSVSMHHSYLKAKQNYSNHGKNSQISSSNATTEMNTCHDTTNTYLHKLHRSKPAWWTCLQEQAYTAKFTPKSMSSSELSATHTFSFFSTKTTSIVFLLLLRASHACSLTGI